MVFILVAVAALAVFLPLTQTRWFKGWYGELRVNLAARLAFTHEYHLLSNISLPVQDRTTQIDHVVISPYGVFVIETKNMRGWIFGKQYDGYWTQKLHKNHSQQFLNPLRQNYKHLKTLAELVHLPEEKFKSVIAFVGHAELKTKMPENVTQGMDFICYVKQHKIKIMTNYQVEKTKQDISLLALPQNRKTRDKHIQYVKETCRQEAG